MPRTRKSHPPALKAKVAIVARAVVVNALVYGVCGYLITQFKRHCFERRREL